MEERVLKGFRLGFATTSADGDHGDQAKDENQQAEGVGLLVMTAATSTRSSEVRGGSVVCGGSTFFCGVICGSALFGASAVVRGPTLLSGALVGAAIIRGSTLVG